MPGKMCSVKKYSLKEKYFSGALCAQKCVCLWKVVV
jgi:hypothetical protein